MAEQLVKHRNNHTALQQFKKTSQFNKKRKKYTVYDDTSDSSISANSETYNPVDISDIRCGVWLTSTKPNFDLRNDVIFPEMQRTANASQTTESVCRSSLTCPYSNEEDIKMIQYFLKNKHLLPHARSTFVYRKMEMKYSFGRTIKSLQKHFLFDVMPKLYAYECLTMDEMIEFHDKTDIPSPELDKLVREHMIEMYGDAVNSSDFDSSESDTSLEDSVQKSNKSIKNTLNPPKKKQRTVENNFHSVVIEDDEGFVLTPLPSTTGSKGEARKSKHNFKSTLGVIQEGVEVTLPQGREDKETAKRREEIKEAFLRIKSLREANKHNRSNVKEISEVKKPSELIKPNQKSDLRPTLCVIEEEVEANLPEKCRSQLHSKAKALPVTSTKEIRKTERKFLKLSNLVPNPIKPNTHKRKLYCNNFLSAIEESPELLPSAANTNQEVSSDYQSRRFKFFCTSNYIGLELDNKKRLWVMDKAPDYHVQQITKARKIPIGNIEYVNKIHFNCVVRFRQLGQGILYLLKIQDQITPDVEVDKELIKKFVEEYDKNNTPSKLYSKNRVSNEPSEAKDNNDPSQTAGDLLEQINIKLHELSVINIFDPSETIDIEGVSQLSEAIQNIAGDSSNLPQLKETELNKHELDKSLRSQHGDSSHHDLPELDSLTVTANNTQNELAGMTESCGSSATNMNDKPVMPNGSDTSLILFDDADSVDLFKPRVDNIRLSQTLEISESSRSSNESDDLVTKRQNYAPKAKPSKTLQCSDLLSISDSDSIKSSDFVLETKSTLVNELDVNFGVLSHEYSDNDSWKYKNSGCDCTQDQNTLDESIYFTADLESQNNNDNFGELPVDDYAQEGANEVLCDEVQIVTSAYFAINEEANQLQKPKQYKKKQRVNGSDKSNSEDNKDLAGSLLEPRLLESKMINVTDLTKDSMSQCEIEVSFNVDSYSVCSSHLSQTGDFDTILESRVSPLTVTDEDLENNVKFDEVSLPDLKLEPLDVNELSQSDSVSTLSAQSTFSRDTVLLKPNQIKVELSDDCDEETSPYFANFKPKYQILLSQQAQNLIGSQNIPFMTDSTLSTMEIKQESIDLSDELDKTDNSETTEFLTCEETDNQSEWVDHDYCK